MTRNEATRYALGVDIGGSHACSAVVDLSTGELCSEVQTTPVDCMAPAGEILERWSVNIRQAVAASGAGAVTRIGIAIPGPFDYGRGVSLISGVNKFDRLFGLDVGESLRAYLADGGDREFRFINDALAFALGECMAGAARDAGRVVALTLGTGVGSGFVENRRLVTTGDRVPANGWVYCLPFGEGIADEAFSTRWVLRRYRELTGQEVAGVREVAECCGDDAAARQLFDEYGRRLADFTGPLLGRFGAQTLLLGGNIARAFPHFGPALARQFAAQGRSIETRVSTLMDRAAMIGAASLFF